MSVKITDLIVASTKPPETDRLEVWDAAVPGFGLRVTANGARSWIVALRRPGSSHPVRIKLGEPGRMPLKAARRLAGEALDDPAAFFAAREPAKVERPQTFAALAEQFLLDRKTKRGGRVLRDATLREYRRALDVYAKPLHHMAVRDIRRADVAHLIRTVATARGAVTGMRTRAALSRLFSWLLANGLVDVNVVTGTEGYAGKKGKRVLTDAELVAIWTATAEPSDYHTIVRLLLWTGARRTEVGAMAYSELRRRRLDDPGHAGRRTIAPWPCRCLRRPWRRWRHGLGSSAVLSCSAVRSPRLARRKSMGSRDGRRASGGSTRSSASIPSGISTTFGAPCRRGWPGSASRATWSRASSTMPWGRSTKRMTSTTTRPPRPMRSSAGRTVSRRSVAATCAPCTDQLDCHLDLRDRVT